MTRIALAIATIAGITLANNSTYAQSNDEALATRRCESELNFVMARENGGRNPEATPDHRRQEVHQVSRTEYEMRGPGMYARDSNDRGRPFTYTCRVDVRSGRVNAQYEWAGGGWDNGDRPGDYPPPPSGSRPGNGNRPGGGYSGGAPQGNIWQSGGLIGRGSGKAMDVEARSNRDAANVQLWQYGGGDNQKWDIIDLGRGQYAIISQGSNKALEVAGGNTADGANVQQFRWNGGDNQRWRFERTPNGYFQIVNVRSGKCVDVQEARTGNGANIQQWSCSGGANQSWKIEK